MPGSMASQPPPSPGPAMGPCVPVLPDSKEEGYGYQQRVSFGDTHEEEFRGDEILNPKRNLRFERDSRVQENSSRRTQSRQVECIGGGHSFQASTCTERSMTRSRYRAAEVDRKCNHPEWIQRHSLQAIRQYQKYYTRHEQLQPEGGRCSSQGEVVQMHAIRPGILALKAVETTSHCFGAVDDADRVNVSANLTRGRSGVQAGATQRPAYFPGLGDGTGVAVQRPELSGLTSSCAALECITGMYQDRTQKSRQLSIGDTWRLVPAGNGDVVAAYVVDIIAERDRKKKRKKKQKKKKKKSKKRKRKTKSKKSKKTKKPKKKGEGKVGEDSSPATATTSSRSTPSNSTTSVTKPTEKIGTVKSDAKTAPAKRGLTVLISRPSMSNIAPAPMSPAVCTRTSIMRLPPTIPQTSQCTNCGTIVPMLPAIGQPPVMRLPSPQQPGHQLLWSSKWGSRRRSPAQSPLPLVEDEWQSPEGLPKPRRRSRTSSRRRRRSRLSRRRSRSRSSKRRRTRSLSYSSSSSEHSSSDDYSYGRRPKSTRRRPPEPCDADPPTPPPMDPGRPMYASPLRGRWKRTGSYPFREARSYDIIPPKVPCYIEGTVCRTASQVQMPVVVESELTFVPQNPDTVARTVAPPTAASVHCVMRNSLSQAAEPQVIQPQPPQFPSMTLGSLSTSALPVVQRSSISLSQLPTPATLIYSQSLPLTPYVSSAPLVGSAAWDPSLYPNTPSSCTFSTDDTPVRESVDTQPSSSSYMSSGQRPMGLYTKQSSDPWWSPYGYMKMMKQQGSLAVTFILLLGIVACVVAIPSRFGDGRPHILRESVGEVDDDSHFIHGPWTNQTGAGTLTEPCGLCRTLECRREGLFLKSLVGNAGACTNFYDYVCALTWKKVHNEGLSSADLMVRDVESSIISFIKAGNVKDRIAEGAIVLWKECMDVDTIRKLDMKPFTTVLNKVGLDGWPYGLAANVSGRNVWNVSGALMRLLSLSTLLAFVVEPIFAYNSALVTIRKRPVQTSTAYFHDNDTIDELLQRIKKRLRLLHPQSEMDEIVSDTLAFLRRISKLT